MNGRLLVALPVALAACHHAADAVHTTPLAPTTAGESTFFNAPDTLEVAAGAGEENGAKMRVHLIDVGQGAATLIEFSCAAMLVDTGGEENEQFHSTDKLVRYLDEFFASRPDLHQTLALLVITHPHIEPDVYEVGHHGSYNATTKELVDAITPKLALIAIGSASRQVTWSAWAYGHPRAVAVELLEHGLTGKPRPAITMPIATGAKKFEDLVTRIWEWDREVAVGTALRH
jgi:beta-lactamase superfamily II metal-dependent hydrolase